MYKHTLLSTLKIKGGVNMEITKSRSLESGLREDFKIQEDEIVRIDSDSLNWRRFTSKDLRITVMKNSHRQEITLSGGVVKGNLIIDGLNDDMEEINIIDCQVEGKIAIYSLKARKVTITGSASSVELINCRVKDLHLCGEVDDEILLANVGMKDSEIEINGSSRTVRMKNIQADKFKFKVFKCALINGRELFINLFFLPTDRSVSLRRINSNKLYFLRNGNSVGVAYQIKDASLEF